METIVNIDIKKLKEDFKICAEKQKFYRNQRKTIHLVGERKMQPSDATYEYQKNGEILRAMYAAYGLGRGKSFSVTESHYPEENHPLQKIQYRIDKIMESYKMLEDVQVQSEI